MFTWFAWFCFLPLATNWMGSDVFGGETKCECADAGCGEAKCRYNEGVALASIGLMSKAAVQFVFSSSVPLLLRVASLKTVWIGCCLVRTIQH